MSKLNLKKIAAADTAIIELLDGHGQRLMTEGTEPQPVTVTIYGPGSKQQAEAVARHRQRSIKARAQNKGREPTADEERASQAVLLADITASSSGLDYGEEGAPTLTGRELYLAVYGDAQLGFIADQINRKSVDWSVFTKPSSTS
jgi:hypothetical protein